MTEFRRHPRRHRALFAGLMAAVLLMKLLVPAGFMPAFANGSIRIELCGGMGAQTMAMPGMASHGADKEHPGKNESPCGFGALSAPALSGADPFLLRAAVAFIVACVFRAAVAVEAPDPGHLRPPPRGPPLFD